MTYLCPYCGVTYDFISGHSCMPTLPATSTGTVTWPPRDFTDEEIDRLIDRLLPRLEQRLRQARRLRGEHV